MSDFNANWVMSELSGSFGSVGGFCIINVVEWDLVTRKDKGIGMGARLAACL